MSDVEMIPKYRFDEVNDRKKELEDRVKSLEAQVKNAVPSDRVKELEQQLAESQKTAAMAEKLSGQVEDLKGKLKEAEERHQRAMVERDRHDALRDLVSDHPSLADKEVRDLFLSKMPEDADDPAEFVRGLTAEGAEVPALLKAFLGEGQSQAAEGRERESNYARSRDTTSASQRQRTAPPAYDERQIGSMTPDEFRAQRASIYAQLGIPVPPSPEGGQRSE